MDKVKVKNLTKMNITLKSFDGGSITLPPQYQGDIDAKYLTWTGVNPKQIRVLGKLPTPAKETPSVVKAAVTASPTVVDTKTTTAASTTTTSVEDKAKG